LDGINRRIKLTHPTYSSGNGDGGGSITITLTQKKND
jgi:hypothetical protein